MHVWPRNLPNTTDHRLLSVSVFGVQCPEDRRQTNPFQESYQSGTIAYVSMIFCSLRCAERSAGSLEKPVAAIVTFCCFLFSLENSTLSVSYPYLIPGLWSRKSIHPTGVEGRFGRSNRLKKMSSSISNELSNVDVASNHNEEDERRYLSHLNITLQKENQVLLLKCISLEKSLMPPTIEAATTNRTFKIDVKSKSYCTGKRTH
jgi:hypothetical protein